MRIKMFISYSSKDEDFVKEIELLLARKFRDTIEPVISAQRKVINIELGEKIYRDIKECQWFMVLLTKNSIKNPTVIHELGYASALYEKGIIHQIIPIVERIQLKKGKMKQINTGVFIHPSIESANYFAKKEKWKECILNIAEYLKRALKVEQKPTTDSLEERAEALKRTGLNWEAAEALKNAGRRHSKSGNIEKAIKDFTEAAKLYKDADYIWESAQAHLIIAKLLEKKVNLREAALEYRKRGDTLSETPDYNWEAANSYEKAGDLNRKEGKNREAAKCYTKAIKNYSEGENDTETKRVKNKLKRIKR